jgi:hypothetical protein
MDSVRYMGLRIVCVRRRVRPGLYSYARDRVPIG